MKGLLQSMFYNTRFDCTYCLQGTGLSVGNNLQHFKLNYQDKDHAKW